MPATLSYPGVYIEEIPSGVRTITGVATSITAFIGRASRGPRNEPTTINSFGDFERQFGGLGLNYPMSYAVRDFYLNGGSQAIIVRLFKPANAGQSGQSHFVIDDLKFVAVSPGVWGNKLRASIDPEVSDDLRDSLGLGKEDPFFNLTLRDARQGGATERIRNVSVKKDSPRRLDRASSQFKSGAVVWRCG